LFLNAVAFDVGSSVQVLLFGADRGCVFSDWLTAVWSLTNDNTSLLSHRWSVLWQLWYGNDKCEPVFIREWHGDRCLFRHL